MTAAQVTNNTGEIEWYTPAPIIEAARRVLGQIDLDPASSEIAQRTVRAAQYFTVDDDALYQSWRGRVWLNPPYQTALIRLFTNRLLLELQAGHVSEAITITNSATETRWAQQLFGQATAICFPSGRVNFLLPDGTTGGAPLQGQMIAAFGAVDLAAFTSEFGQFGNVLQVVR